MHDNEISNKEQHVPHSKPLPVHEPEETWKILADFRVSLPLVELIKLVPQFTEKMTTLMAQKDV